MPSTEESLNSWKRCTAHASGRERGARWVVVVVGHEDIKMGLGPTCEEGT